FSDLPCCDVFLYDDTDQNDRCHQTCKFILRSPSLPSKEKLHFIKKCRKTNPLNNCFNLCRVEMNEHSAKGLTNFKWLEPDVCTRYKMQDGVLYPFK
ncbi:hypothetical protein PENTCL1PPCAC_18563, partial [Pristionchus entomophagus]